jgi:hypothetical protein
MKESMAKESLGDKLEKQVQNLKGGLKGVAEKLTAEDTEPRTVAMAGPISGARPPVHRERERERERERAVVRRIPTARREGPLDDDQVRIGEGDPRCSPLEPSGSALPLSSMFWRERGHRIVLSR